MEDFCKSKTEFYETILRLDNQIRDLTAIRNTAEFEVVSKYFGDYSLSEADYLKWLDTKI
jgi:hypothetical protein